MKLPKPPCYWESNLRHNYRRCKDCYKMQYNYSGTWEDKLTFDTFVRKWSNECGNGTVDIKIETGTEFEFRCYESWERFFNVSILRDGEWLTVTKCENWNDADWSLRKTIDNLK